MKPLKPHSSKLAALWILILCVAVPAMILLKKCSSPRALVNGIPIEKAQGDTLDVAIDYSPISVYVTGDTLGGLNYEILQSLSGLGNLPIKIHPVTSLDEALQLLDKRVYDIVVTDMPVTLDFKDKYLFSEDVYLDRQVLVQYVDSIDSVKPVESQLELGGKHVWVVAKSPAESRLRNLSAEIGDTIYVESDPQYSAEMLYMLTSIGEIKYCVVNERLARAMVEKGGKAGIATNISFTQFQAWVLRKGNTELKENVDSLLLQFKETDAYRKICERYLNR